MAGSNEPGSLTCAICLDELKRPVALHCGHSYCMDCVNTYWDQEDRHGVYSCPQCRHTFPSRPLLNKSTALVDLMGRVSGAEKRTSANQDGVSTRDVDCDFCTAGKLKAVKTCLVCLASYCATHLQPHYESAAFKKHKLVDVSTPIEERICSKHDKLLEVYCRSDGQCVCLLCVMDEHKGHDTVSAAAERREKQKQFGKKTQIYRQGIQEKDKQLRQLRQQIKALQCAGDAAADQNEKAYAEIIHMADMRRCAVRERIRVQEKAAVSQAEALVDRLEEEICELGKGEDELKRLSITEDHIHFLQSFQSISQHPEPNTNFSIQLHKPFKFVTKTMSDWRDKMENVMKALDEISKTIQVNLDHVHVKSSYCISPTSLWIPTQYLKTSCFLRETGK